MNRENRESAPVGASVERRECSCNPNGFGGPEHPELDACCQLHGLYDADGKWIHPNKLSREALRALVGDLSWMALDLAQHLNFMNLQYGQGGRRTQPYNEADAGDAVGYVAAERMAYAISNFPYHGPEAAEGIRRTPGIAIFDGTGGFS